MSIKDKIQNFLESETQQKIEDRAANLIEKNILDSFTMIKLISFLESELSVKVDMEELSPENFNSVDKISEFVEKK